MTIVYLALILTSIGPKIKLFTFRKYLACLQQGTRAHLYCCFALKTQLAPLAYQMSLSFEKNKKINYFNINHAYAVVNQYFC